MLRRITLQKGSTPKFVTILVKKALVLSFLAYLGAFAYVYFLTEPSNVENTRVSNNAFMPGFVTERFDKHSSISMFSKNLRNAFKNKNAKSYVMESLKERGLEVYNQSFKLDTTYMKVEGENIYGILRSRKMAPVESMLMVVPFDEEHLMSAVLALTMADYFRNQVYWARDIIFLFAHPSAVGMEAWISSFHGHQIPNLYAAPLEGRSGAIIGAFIYDLIGQHFVSADLKFYGVNGRQPNLDLVNVVAKISRKSSFPSIINGLYPQEFVRYPPNHQDLLHSLAQTIYDQTFVEIDGLHSVFGSYGISAVTIAGRYPSSNRDRHVDISDMAMFIEACFRSLNNVLERLHRSYFLYYLLSPDKFLSVAYYMPIAGFFIIVMLLCGLREYYCISNFVVPKAYIYNHLLALGLYFVTVFLFSNHLLDNSLIAQGSLLLGAPIVLYFATFLYPIESVNECVITRFAFFVEFGLIIGSTSLISISPGLVIGAIGTLPILLLTQVIPSGKIYSPLLSFLMHPLVMLFAGQFILAHFLGYPSYNELKMDLNPIQTALTWSLQGIVMCLHKHLIHSSLLFPLYSIILLSASSNLASITRFRSVLLPKPTFLNPDDNKIKAE